MGIQYVFNNRVGVFAEITFFFELQNVPLSSPVGKNTNNCCFVWADNIKICMKEVGFGEYSYGLEYCPPVD